MRKPMVTRTVTFTSGKALCVDTSNCETITMDYTVSGKHEIDSPKLRKMVERNLILRDGVVVVKIMTAETSTKLMGMSEADFIANAEEIER